MKASVPLSVGSRELKTRLGTYLRRVREGMTLIITDRGRPIAELRPLDPRDSPLAERLRELAAAGLVGGAAELRERASLPYFRPLAIARSAGLDGTLAAPALSDALRQDREDRF
jgi:prevent-host-death family protein